MLRLKFRPINFLFLTATSIAKSTFLLPTLPKEPKLAFAKRGKIGPTPGKGLISAAAVMSRVSAQCTPIMKRSRAHVPVCCVLFIYEVIAVVIILPRFQNEYNDDSCCWLDAGL